MKEYDTKINEGKSVVMVTGGTTEKIKLGGTSLKKVNAFRYFLSIAAGGKNTEDDEKKNQSGDGCFQ